MFTDLVAISIKITSERYVALFHILYSKLQDLQDSTTKSMIFDQKLQDLQDSTAKSMTLDQKLQDVQDSIAISLSMTSNPK